MTTCKESTDGFDALVAGEVFLDLIFTGANSYPQPGTEVFANGLTMSPGGVANVAVALARLGSRVGLVTALDTGVAGEWLMNCLGQDGVDLSHCSTYEGGSQSTTVSLVSESDRSMLTHLGGVAAPRLDGGLPAARAYFEYVHHDHNRQRFTADRPPQSLLVLDTGWDASGVWATSTLARLDRADVFLPNAAEAMAYTRTQTPLEAARMLAERVPLAVVKCGSAGAVAVDGETGRVTTSPGLPLVAVDTTGAGDVFAAGFVFATLEELELQDCLAFANLCAGLSVTRCGGAVSAPTWPDIEAAVRALSPDAGARYSFLHDLPQRESTMPASLAGADSPHQREVPVA